MQETTNAGMALRALQKLDELEHITHRELLLEAQDALGRELGLECSGRREGDHGDVLAYDHSGNTCRIHEWLVPADSEEVPSP